MAHSNENKVDRFICCASCGRVIGQGFIVEGAIQLLCKCGVKTKIEAQPKKKPEGQRVIAYEPGFDSRGRLSEISIVSRKVG